MLFRAQMSMVIADSLAHNEWSGTKGASANKPCVFCANIVSAKSGWAEADISGRLKCASCTDPTKFEEHTDESFYREIERMRGQKAVLRKGEFEQLEVDMGWSWNDDCCFVDPQCQQFFKPISMTFPDWMHVWVVNGIINREVVLFLDCIIEH